MSTLWKSALFGYFWGWNCEKLLSYLKSAPSSLYICKILRKNRNAYIMEKYLIWLFLGWMFKKLFSHLKSAPSNFYIYKGLGKNKNAYVMEMCLIWLYLGWSFQKLLSHLKSAPSNFSKMSVTHTVNFGTAAFHTRETGN